MGISKRVIVIIGVGILLFTLGRLSSGFAVEFQPIGFEALSMGGAGVAQAKGSFCVYYNPALLAESHKGVEISFSVGIGAREINLVDHIDTLADIDITSTLDRIVDNAPSGSNSTEDRNNITTIKNELRDIAQINGLQLMPTASVGVRIGSIGLGVFGVSEGSAYAVIDSNKLDIIVKKTISGTDQYFKYDEGSDTYSLSTQNKYESKSLEYALNNDLTYLQLTGLAYTEVPLAYACQIKTPLGAVSLGAAIKYMYAITYDNKIKIDTESGEIEDVSKEADKRDDDWGIDVGLLYRPPAIQNLLIGITAKNINQPEFATIKGDKYKLDPMVRAGVSWGLVNKISFAFDVDLTKNDTFLPGYASRYVGGGVNIHPTSWISLRAGLMDNVEESREGVVYTAGIGFGLKWAQIDISGQYSSKSGEYNGQTIPRYGRVQIALVSKWF